MDRTGPPGRVAGRAVPVARAEPEYVVRAGQRAERAERGTDAPRGRGIHGSSVLRQPADDGGAAPGGYAVNRKRVLRLMRQMGLAAIYPKPALSRPDPDHRLYPYLLRGVTVTGPDQVWSTDITYIRLLRDSSTWRRSWTGTAARCWRGDSPTPWRPGSAWTVWTRRCGGVNRRSSTRTRRAVHQHGFTGRLAQAGIRISMDGRDGPMTISLWNGCGDRSSMKKCIPTAMTRWMTPITGCTGTSSSTTNSGPSGPGLPNPSRGVCRQGSNSVTKRRRDTTLT